MYGEHWRGNLGSSCRFGTTINRNRLWNMMIQMRSGGKWGQISNNAVQEISGAMWKTIILRTTSSASLLMPSFFLFFFCSSCCFSLCILIPSSAHANAPHMLNAHSEHKSMDYVAAANGSGRGFPLVSSYNFHLFSITIPHPSMCICMEHTTHFSQLELRAILEFEHIFSEALAALPITQIAACVCVLCDIGKKK